MTEWIKVETEDGADRGTTRVPNAWYEHTQRAVRGYQELIERYDDVPEVTGFAMTNGDVMIDGESA